ncbi:MAG: YqaJ viral recombinase family protein [Prevotella sp.]|nr:YqaJ viral recombinase family protein [Prevotella sp.]
MQNVTVDRHKYIGGSDIPIIMGLSPFKTRFELLQEKAQIRENDFAGNEYTDYGNIMEETIRDYINEVTPAEFVEDKTIRDDLRYHADGFDISGRQLLEIKTTSQVYENIEDYKAYLVQLIFGLIMYNIEYGLLAVYERPDDFDTAFDVDRLHLYHINIKEWGVLVEKIKTAVDSFRDDLKKIKADPFLTEEELQPAELVQFTDKIIVLEQELKSMKAIEKQLKEAKQELKSAMEKRGIKKWTTNNGTQITLVADGEDKTVSVFDEAKFKAENEELYNFYQVGVKKKGRAGYVKITLPKK